MADQITADDVLAVVAKLEEWGNSLPDKERAVLRTILSNISADTEVEGFGMPGVPGVPGAAGLPFAFQPGAVSLVNQVGLGMDKDPLFIQVSPARQNQPRQM